MHYKKVSILRDTPITYAANASDCINEKGHPRRLATQDSPTALRPVNPTLSSSEISDPMTNIPNCPHCDNVLKTHSIYDGLFTRVSLYCWKMDCSFFWTDDYDTLDGAIQEVSDRKMLQCAFK